MANKIISTKILRISNQQAGFLSHNAFIYLLVLTLIAIFCLGQVFGSTEWWQNLIDGPVGFIAFLTLLISVFIAILGFFQADMKNTKTEIKEDVAQTNDSLKEDMKEVKIQVYNHIPTQIRNLSLELKEDHKALKEDYKSLKLELKEDNKTLKEDNKALKEEFRELRKDHQKRFDRIEELLKENKK